MPGFMMVLSSTFGRGGGGAGPVMPSEAGVASHPARPSPANRSNTFLMVRQASCARSALVPGAARVVAVAHGPRRVAARHGPSAVGVPGAAFVAAAPHASPGAAGQDGTPAAVPASLAPRAFAVPEPGGRPAAGNGQSEAQALLAELAVPEPVAPAQNAAAGSLRVRLVLRGPAAWRAAPSSEQNAAAESLQVRLASDGSAEQPAEPGSPAQYAAVGWPLAPGGPAAQQAGPARPGAQRRSATVRRVAPRQAPQSARYARWAAARHAPARKEAAASGSRLAPPDGWRPRPERRSVLGCAMAARQDVRSPPWRETLAPAQPDVRQSMPAG